VAITKAEGWWIDGVRLDRWGVVNDDNGVILSDRKGWDDTPGVRGSNTVLLGAHGESWRRKKFGPGRKTLAITVNGTGAYGWDVPATGILQRAAYEEALDALLRLFSKRHEPLSVERVHANGDRRQADCEVVTVITPEAIGDTAGRMTVELSVHGGFWEDTDATTHALQYDVAGANSQDCEVYSLAGQTAPCADPVIVVTGPCTTLSVTDTETGEGFSYATALSGADTLTVDAGAWTALNGATSVITDLVLSGQQILEIVPAPADNRGPTVTVNAPGATAGFTVTLTTRRKWLR
jgi:hypothetical protein